MPKHLSKHYVAHARYPLPDKDPDASRMLAALIGVDHLHDISDPPRVTIPKEDADDYVRDVQAIHRLAERGWRVYNLTKRGEWADSGATWMLDDRQWRRAADSDAGLAWLEAYCNHVGIPWPRPVTPCEELRKRKRRAA